jgi:hypothetical protein
VLKQAVYNPKTDVDFAKIMITNKPTIRLVDFILAVSRHYGGDSRCNELLTGDCLNFAIAAQRFLRNHGIRAYRVYLGMCIHAALKVGQTLFDGAGLLTSKRLRYYKFYIVRENRERMELGLSPHPLNFVHYQQIKHDPIMCWNDILDPKKVQRIYEELQEIKEYWMQPLSR